MFEEYEAQIRREAVESFPEEAVWLITEAGCYLVENIHEDPTEFFRVSEEDVRAAIADGLLAIVHSHPKNIAAPSAADMQSQLDTGVPWGVLGTDGIDASSIAWWGAGVEKPPLIGRGFRHGVTDCYALIKDYYEQELGVVLPEFPRDWEWWLSNQDLFLEGFPRAGFRQVTAEQARPGDVWLAQIGSKVPCHGGVLLEDGLTIHQPGARVPVDEYRLSVREPVFRYQRFITHWLRYEGTSA